MPGARRARALWLASACCALIGADTAHAQEHAGQAVYERWCAECHGYEGRGDGPAAAYMLPRPRNFTQARYQIRTTATSELPTDADIMRVIEHGMPGTSMPGWPRLSRQDRTRALEYIKTFSPFFESEQPPQPIRVGRAPRATDAALAEGRRLYDQLECWKCHGQAGRSDGESAPTLRDDYEQPIRAADLTKNWLFNGGGTVQDIYTRLMTGMDGTPMPSLADVVAAGAVTEEDVWHIALYVHSLSPERPPAPQEVIRARLHEAALPDSPDDDVWQEVPRFYVPLVGQIVVKPRWFAPTVNSVSVQALHDGRELVLRVSWNDPSRSPDPTWAPWRARVVQAMEPKEAPPTEGALPDALVVQFPSRLDAREPPYFLMGDARNAVYLWSWRSDTGGSEALGSGLGRTETLAPDGAALRAEATFEHGEWRLLLRRTLMAEDTVFRPSFPTGEPVPIAFFAWDGSSGEGGARGAISSWYYLHLERPATASVYVTPVIAGVLTALLAIVLAMRVQRGAQSARAPGGEGQTRGLQPHATRTEASS